MSGARAVALGALLALVVAIAQQGIVRLVTASGARDVPATVLVLLLAAFLGVLTAVATRMLRLPGAVAPTVLVMGWIAVPALLNGIPGDAAQLFARSIELGAQDAVALVAATLATVVTLGVPADR